ncbi:MAG: beta-galactosidase trimerization domain-containing protein, partial [Flavitalea sp.]
MNINMPTEKGKNELSRRNFLEYSAVLTGGLIVSPMLGNANSSPQIINEQTLHWYQKPLRIMHTVLRESDAKDYNADAVVDYIKKIGGNTLCVNAGGIVDFFQNPLPAANLNAYMGKRDILSEISTACKKEGIRVIGRIDFRGVEEHVYKKFPSWFKKDADGNPVQTNYTKPRLYESCYMGQYRNEYANQFVAYVLKTYGLDGIWHNAPGFNGICYCSRCMEGYKAFSGKTLPLLTAPQPELDEYMKWKTEAADQCMDRIKKTVKSFGIEKAYTAEVFSIYAVSQQRIDSGVDLNNARKHFDILVSVAFLTENNETIHYENLNYGSTIIKFLKSMAPEREAVVMYGGNGTSHRLVIDPPIDLNVWLWEILSAGGRFWNCYFTNVPTVTHDRRNAFNESAAYNFVKTNEALLEQHVPVASIGIYYSRATRLSYRDKSVEGDRFGTEIRGVETVMMENHILHDFILDDQVSREGLQRYELVVLPNVRCMSEKEINLLKEYVHGGGNLIATYATSLFDTNGKERSDFGLAEVFGLNYAGKKENTKKDNYQFILNKKHPIVEPDSSSTELLFTAGFTVLTKPVKASEVICTWVPTIQNQPPDKASVHGFPTDYPTIIEHGYGKGKIIYFANQPDVLSIDPGHPDPRNLLLRSIRHLTDKGIRITTNAPSSVHIGLTRSLNQPGQYVLSMVNTTSAPVRPIRELIPVSDISVKLKLNEKSLSRHQVLRCHGECKLKADGEFVNININRLQDFFAVHIEM